MQKDVELLIIRKRALMNENLSKAGAYSAEAEDLATEINSLVDLINQKNDFEKQCQELTNENEMFKKQIEDKKDKK